MSLAHRLWSSTGSAERPITLTPLLSNSGFIFAMVPSSVVQTGVKSLGWEKSTAHLSPIHWWKSIWPSVVWAWKLGAVSPMRSAMGVSGGEVENATPEKALFATLSFLAYSSGGDCFGHKLMRQAPLQISASRAAAPTSIF